MSLSHYANTVGQLEIVTGQCVVLQVSGANLQETAPWGGSESLGNVLLEPTVIYVKRLLALTDAVDVKVSVCPCLKCKPLFTHAARSTSLS